MRIVHVLLFPFVAASAAFAGEAVDPRIRTFVDPVRVVWQSEPSRHGERSKVSGAEILLGRKHGQVPELGWERLSDGCILENDGENPALLLDFGRELHGGLRLSFGDGCRRARVRICLGESVSEALSSVGGKTATNDHAVRDDTVEIPSFGVLEFGQTGFRFARISLETPGRVVLQSARAVSLMRPMKAVGSFCSSDGRLNRIFETAIRTVHLCCQDYLWDGIKRDRLVWMGDTHPETMAILNVFGAMPILPETLAYAAETTPIGTWMNRMPTYTLWWIRNLAAWYRYAGDKAFLERQADYLEKTFDFVSSAVDAQGKWTQDAFLDWPTRHNKVAEAAGTQGLLLLTARETVLLAKALGRDGFVERASRLASRLEKVDAQPAGEKSAAALLALSGLQDPQEMYRRVLSCRGHEGVSTFYGYYMLEAMSAADQDQRALDTVRDYWGGMLDVGATSFWEDFNLSWTNACFRIDELPVPGKTDVHGDYGEFCYSGFRHSLCHGWSAGPAAWCIGHVLGIRPMDVGCKTVEVRPFLGDLAWARGAMALPTGEKVSVEVRKMTDGTLESKVTAPTWVRIVR